MTDRHVGNGIYGQWLDELPAEDRREIVFGTRRQFLVQPSDNFAAEGCDTYSEAIECAREYAAEITGTVYVFDFHYSEVDPIAAFGLGF